MVTTVLISSPIYKIDTACDTVINQFELASESRRGPGAEARKDAKHQWT